MSAKQFGTHRLSGTVGDITYSHTRNGFKAREKTRVNMAERYNSPNYQAWRDNMAEFRNAAQSATIFRSGFVELTGSIKNKSIVSQTLSLMSRVIKTDSMSLRGQRNAAHANLSQIPGFEFTGSGNIDAVLKGGYSASFNRQTGEGEISIHSFLPKQRLGNVANATHFKMHMGLSSINFNTGFMEKKVVSDEALPLNDETLESFTLTESLTPNRTDPVFIALKLEFLAEVNGYSYPVLSNTHTCCTVILVDQV